MHPKYERALHQLKALLLKNWWVKRHHGYIGLSVELFFPIIITLLVAGFFLSASQTSGNFVAEPASSLADFTAYQECYARSPYVVDTTPTSYNSSSSTGGPKQTDKCVVGIAPRGASDSQQMALFEEILPYITSKLAIPYLIYDNETLLELDANNYTIWAGIIVNVSSPISSPSSELPYSIRITSSLLPAAMYPDKEPNVFFSLISNYLARGAKKFEYSGFFYLQSVVEPALLNYKLDTLGINNSSSPTSSPVSFSTWNAIYKSQSTNVPLIVLLSASLLQIAYIPAIMFASFDLVAERKSKNYLKAMGMPEYLYQFCWFLYIYGSMLGTSMVIFVGSAVLGLMNGIAGPAFGIVMLYTFSIAALVFLISSLSRSKQVAAVFVLTVIGFVPNSLAVFLTNSGFAAKALFSLFSPVAFVFSIVECFRNHLVQSSHLVLIPDDLLALGTYSLGYGYGILVLDSLLYLILGWYFHNVYTKHNPRPMHFLFTRDYWASRQIDLDGEDASSWTSQQQLEALGLTVEDTNKTNEPDISSVELEEIPMTARGMRKPLDMSAEHFEAVDLLEESTPAHIKERKRIFMEERKRLGTLMQGAAHASRDWATTKIPAPPGVGVSMTNVHKVYSGAQSTLDDQDRHVITGLSLEALRNQVFVLAGENGSGKSSVIEILAGLTPFTSGTVLVEGVDVKENRRQVRQTITLCAQEDMLLEQLSVKQHVVLAARLKGLESSEATERRVDNLLQSLKLDDVSDLSISACNRSQKKKVSLAVAFASDSKVVLLDEPTIGLDPESRETIWNVILANKIGRTIILTTHLMAEADALADRIGIMRNGVIVACGSPTFLKRDFGVGYYLQVQKSADADPRPIAHFIQSRIEGSKLVLVRHPTQTSLRFTLPFSEQSRYPDLFQDLETQIDAHSALGIESFAVTLTSLEDVFDQQVNSDLSDKGAGGTALGLKLLKESREIPKDDNDDGSSSDSAVDISEMKCSDILPDARRHRPAPFLQQLRVLVHMRARTMFRRFSSLMCMFLVPIIAVFLIFLAFVFGSSAIQLPQILNGTRTSATTDPVALSFEGILPLEIPYVTDTTKGTDISGFNSILSLWNETYPPQTTSLLKGTSFASHQTLGAYLWQDALPDHRWMSWIVEGFTIENRSLSVGLLYNKTESYSLPIAFNLLTNSLLATYIHQSNLPKANGLDDLKRRLNSIKLTMEPFDPIPNIKSIAYNFDNRLLSAFSLYDVAWSLGLATCLAILLALLTQDRVRERVFKLKFQMQIMGASLQLFWLSNYLVDTVRLLISFAVIVICGLILQFQQLQGMYLGAFIILALLWIPAALSMAYFLSRFYSVPKSCFKWVLLLYWSMYIFHYVIIFAIQIGRLVVVKTNLDDIGPFSSFLLTYLSLLTPFSTLSSAMFDLTTVMKDFTVHQISPSFSYLMNWSRLGRHVCFLVLHSVMWSSLLLGIGHLESTLRNPSSSSPLVEEHLEMEEMENGAEEQDDEDIDIRRIRMRITGGEYENSIVRVDNLTKIAPKTYWLTTLKRFFGGNRFDSFKDISEQAQELSQAPESVDLWDHSDGSLVSNVYFVAQPGDCFGIVGPRGSGKSTLLSLIIGEQAPSSGFITVNGQSIYSTQDTLFGKALISYSPQGRYLSLYENLTVLEHLKLFFLLRNQLEDYELSAMIEYSLAKMELKPYADIRCESLNATIRRRLRLALALFTGNRVAVLDEPTLGMEPAMKRKIWSTIREVCAETGLCVIWATESMKEAQNVCNQYGIFVKGRFQCMGSSEYLQNRFEQGYHLKVLLEDIDPEDSAKAQTILQAVRQKYRSASSFPRPLTASSSNPSSSTSTPQSSRHAANNKNSITAIDEDGDTSAESSNNGCNTTTDSSSGDDTMGDIILDLANHNTLAETSAVSHSVQQAVHFKRDLQCALIDQFVKENFSTSRILTSFGKERVYFLGLLESPAWAFDLMETNKKELGIVEYSLSQTTLLEVFTQFSRNQEIPDQ